MSDFALCERLIDSYCIKKGEIVQIASDLTLLLIAYKRKGVKLSPDYVLDLFIEKVGSTGVLLVPTFNWDFCHGEGFHYFNTPCMVGSLGTAALRRKDFMRTRHPMYSWAVYGKDSRLLFELNNKSAFGYDSPFGYLHKNDAKHVWLGLEPGIGITFVHYVQQCNSDIIKYRYLKDFTDKYIDHNGEESTRTYSMFVRNYDMNTVDQIDKQGAYLKLCDTYIDLSREGIPLSCIRLGAAYDHYQKDIRENKSRNICTYIGQD